MHFFLADGSSVYQEPIANSSAKVVVKPDSSRLQLLQAFPAWKDEEITDMPVLLKVSGKCTTDHISAAGPWLKYKVRKR
jgi:aconitate hydratase